MPHPLVLQLRFARSEFRRALDGVADADARRRFLPMNCLSWNVGHLAAQEQRYWLWRAQGRVLLPGLQESFGYGAPASTPPLDEMWDAWRAVTGEVDPWLDALGMADLTAPREGSTPQGIATFTFANLLQRVIYHYWYHTGENMAIRQMLEHKDLPEFVGNIDDEAPYTPERPS